MNILTFDTSFDHCSVALVPQEGQMVCDIEPLQRGHAEALIPKIEKLLQQTGISFQEIGLIAVGAGPGSFTGVRVAVATARGLELAAKIPVVAINSFAVFSSMALPKIKEDEQLYVVLDARRRDLFYQAYDAQGVPEFEPQMTMPQDLLQLILENPSRVIGTGVRRLELEQVQHPTVLQEIGYDWQEYLKVLAHQAEAILHQGQGNLPCQPYYLAPPGITLN
ncbi:MAG: tRNA (adenosine(37)-N6)-threonylcarbamoyltransferase complex dimerization subunit type 1 TsaB [Pseudomonadota bacterium]